MASAGTSGTVSCTETMDEGDAFVESIDLYRQFGLSTRAI